MPAFVAAKDLPLRLGNRDEFDRVRDFFQTAKFDEENVCRALALNSMCELGLVNWQKYTGEGISAPLRWCIDVFVRGLAADLVDSEAICGAETTAAFRALGLLRPARKVPASVVCPVWLYPCAAFLVASDRTNDPDGDPFLPGEDVVFPAIYPGTLRFLQLLPEAQNGDVLDLCGGSGIGALHLSRTARSTITADLTERAALFADFNGRLNGVPLASVCGDLYEPVAGRQFDLITAHPPFVPAVGPNMVYRDGGDTGEEVTRRIIEGLPVHLRAGGICVILCVACDTEKASFEQRARDWLGEQRNEFDLVFGCEKILSVNEMAASLRRGQKKPDDAEVQKLLERLHSFNTRQFPYGTLFIRRLGAPTAPEPLRLQLMATGRVADFQRVLAWRERARQPDFRVWLANSRPKLADQLELTIRHVMQDGELAPAQFTFTIGYGFQASLRPDGWVVPLVARLNGKISVQEVFEGARSADDLPPGFTLEAFTDLIRQMVERGFLVADAV